MQHQRECSKSVLLHVITLNFELIAWYDMDRGLQILCESFLCVKYCNIDVRETWVLYVRNFYVRKIYAPNIDR
jgi:hypothetical protein